MAEYNLGPIRMNFKGEYDEATEYRFMDNVTYQGSSYVCKNLDSIDGVGCIGVAPFGEPKSEVYWAPQALKGEKGDAADYYRPFMTVTDAYWDFSHGDKIFIPTDATDNKLEIANLQNGSCGLILTQKDLELPRNSFKAIDFGYIELTNIADYYIYTFVYTNIGTGIDYFFWHRSVVTKAG